MEEFLRAEKLVKSYGHTVALKGVDVVAGQGESIILLGPNGAGKSTLLGILAGSIRPADGSVLIGGQKIGTFPDLRGLIGYLTHDSLLYPGLTAMENLLFFGRLYRVEDLPARAEEMLRFMGLWDRRNDRVGGFSRGMEQRLSIARALLHNPQLLLLDEPFSGLDYQSSRSFADVLTALEDKQRTFILATHDLEAARGLGKRVLFLNRGKMFYDGPVPDDVGLFYAGLLEETGK